MNYCNPTLTWNFKRTVYRSKCMIKLTFYSESPSSNLIKKRTLTWGHICHYISLYTIRCSVTVTHSTLRPFLYPYSQTAQMVRWASRQESRRPRNSWRRGRKTCRRGRPQRTCVWTWARRRGRRGGNWRRRRGGRWGRGGRINVSIFQVCLHFNCCSNLTNVPFFCRNSPSYIIYIIITST